MKCWICGEDASTGEHMTKASDLRAMFGSVSLRKPLFMHTAQGRNQPVPGINSGKLKFKTLLCPQCNNQRTQPHDRAWEALSRHLRERTPRIRPGGLIKLAPVFPGCIRASMLDVHLYFLKLFGCLIVEYSVPLNIQEFANAILGRRAHPRVHIAFSAVEERDRVAGMSQVHAESLQGTVAFATWSYFLGSLHVTIMYATPEERRFGLIDSWHPATVTKLVRIKKY